MPTAYVHIRETPHYRKDSFDQGLSRLGYSVVSTQPDKPLRRDDVVVCWNKTGRSSHAIQMAREGGAAVIITENGYYGVDENGVQRYALALDGHNGSGRWYAPDDSRLKALHIPFQPMRVPDSDRVLIAAQRGLGSQLMRSPAQFEQRMSARLIRAGYAPRVRLHPAGQTPSISLLDDLADCAALVVWSSNCATAALIAGVPTFYAAPTIVTAGSARPVYDALDHNFWEFGQMKPFEEMAWAQWTVRELTSGEPFALLRAVHEGVLPSCRPGIDLA